MKKTTFTLLLSLSCCWLAAQCPTDITFSTQGQVDSFPGNYPVCTEIKGDVVISGGAITSLDSLLSLKKISGQLRIEQTGLPNLNGLNNLDSVKLCFKITGNPVLTGLTGLGKLKYVGKLQEVAGDTGWGWGFEILDNPLLASLNGLDNLNTAAGCVKIINNPLLTSLTGLGSLTAVGACYFFSPGTPGRTYGLNIEGNATLTTLDGLGNLGSLQELVIGGNPILTSLAALESVQGVYGNLSISGNPSLSSIDPLGNIQEIGGGLTISGIPALKSLTPFGNIQTLGGGLGISSNPSLKSLSGLDNIQSIGGRLSIGGNDSLTTLSGLENLDSLGQCLNIWGNPALVSFDALAGLRSIGRCRVKTGHISFFNWNIEIEDNPQLGSIQGLEKASIKTLDLVRITGSPLLSMCSIESICQYLKNGGKVEASDNAPGCNSIPEVEAACIVSIGETSTGELAIVFSPNPASDFLQIQVSDNEKWEISLFDLRGRLLYQQMVSGSQTIFIGDFPSGLYTLRAVSGRRAYGGRFMKW